MDIQKFRENKRLLDKGIPFPKGVNHDFLIFILQEAAKPQHAFENIGKNRSNQFGCSCGGGEIPSYLSDPENAFDCWLDHVAKAMGLQPKVCPCGKSYIPADGGKPCHELRAIE